MNTDISSAINRADFSEYKEDSYSKISMNELVTFAACQLAQTQIEITAENLVAACYYMFPRRFSLRGYPHWPDSTVINKRWIDCRSKGYLSGSTAKGFSVTPKGANLASKTIGKLNLSNSSKSIHKHYLSEQRTKAGRLVQYLENSDAFKVFSSDDGNDKPTEFDMRMALQCTMESPTSLLRKNLDLFRQNVEIYKKYSLMEFLDFLSEELGLANSDNGNNKGTSRGGMLPQKHP